MADLSVNFAGIRSPNPFWLASAPPTNTADQVMRAFDAGWGGAVWKTVGEPIVNVTRSVKDEGHKVLNVAPENGHFRLLVEKRQIQA